MEPWSIGDRAAIQAWVCDSARSIADEHDRGESHEQAEHRLAENADACVGVTDRTDQGRESLQRRVFGVSHRGEFEGGNVASIERDLDCGPDTAPACTLPTVTRKQRMAGSRGLAAPFPRPFVAPDRGL
ncbi:hypothetical protein GCM10009676_39030 [Prauserella halophila]|uniref:Uncharacterized protein n=1 Tax=Prauserella halophila TaxID=185641 RepID=A0ABN1WM45_9PSEU